MRSVTLIVLLALAGSSFAQSTAALNPDEARYTRFVRPFSPDSSRERTPLVAVPAEDGQLRVSSLRQWSETGLAVRKGQVLEFTAAGEVRGAVGPPGNWALGPWGPEGGDSTGSNCCFPERLCALIGQVQSDTLRDEFFIGAAMSYTVPFDGRLLLGVSDIYHHDNSGEFIVKVKSNGFPVDFREVAMPVAAAVVSASTDVNYLGQANYPKIIKLDPPNGATDVDAASPCITVTFDRPMSGGYSWVDKGARPPITSIEWLNDHECRAWVTLEPAKEYGLWLNFGPNTCKFRSAEGISSQRTYWSFKTR